MPPATGRRTRLAAYGAEDLLETLLQLLADGQRRAQVHPHPRVDRVRPVRGEADGQQEVGGYDAMAGASPGVAERLDRPDVAAEDQVLGHPLHQHPAQPDAAVLLRDVRGGQDDGVVADRRGREPVRGRDVHRRSPDHVADHLVVDQGHPAARSPLAQHHGDPRGLLLGLVTAHRVASYGIELPEHAAPAVAGELVEVIQRQPLDLASHAANRRPRSASSEPQRWVARKSPMRPIASVSTSRSGRVTSRKWSGSNQLKPVPWVTRIFLARSRSITNCSSSLIS